MREYFSIGEVSKITGISINMLRHYDKIGLCRPVLVNDETNYRYYHANQLFYFDVILLARRTGMSLEEVKEVLDTKNMVRFKLFLEEIKLKSEEKIEELKGSIIDIANINDRVKTSEVLVRTKGLYQREIYERDVVTSEMLDPSVYNSQIKQMSLLENIIKENELQSTFESGTIYQLQDELQPVAIYKGVILNYDTDVQIVTRIPHGNYLCVNYTENTREKALKQLLNGIEELQLSSSLIVDSSLMSDIFNHEVERRELQVFAGEV